MVLMSTFFGRRRTDPPERTSPPDPLEVVRSASARMDSERRRRDQAIADARASTTERRPTIRELAEAAELSVSRVKQIAATGGWWTGEGPTADRAPITDADLYGPGTTHRGDRTLALADVAPHLPRWPSEQAFIAADPARAIGVCRRYDISTDLYDDDLHGRWVAVFIDRTCEVYAFAATPLRRANSTVTRTPDTDDTEQGDGSLSGPCLLLGHLPSYEVVDVAVNNPANVVNHRLGGLAWLYGRIALVNRTIKALTDPFTGFISPAPDQPATIRARTYLDSLPESERP